MDLSNLRPDQIAALKAQLFPEVDAQGRSPFKPRQLHDLRLLPTKDDPRPLFISSAEGDRNLPIGAGTPYPKLLWHGTTNAEIAVWDGEEEQEKLASGYVLLPIEAIAVDPVMDLAQMLAGLPEAEQALILAAQQQTRRDDLQSKLAALPAADLAKLLASLEATPEAAKRGPGRPRKEAVA